MHYPGKLHKRLALNRDQRYNADIMAKTTTKKASPKLQKPSAKAKKPAVSQKVDYYPNRMSFYISLVAAVLILFLATITAL